MESTVLQTFWSLSSTEEGERIDAAKELFTLLKQHQTTSTAEGACHELKYAVQRLVRGLASSRKGARHGYYTALTEIVAQFPQLSPTETLELFHTHLEPSKGSKSAEIRGACFGKAFGLLSLVKSGVLVDKEAEVGVANELIALGKERVYLKEFCASVLCQLLETCSLDVCKDAIVPKLELDKGWDNCSAERLQILLHLKKSFGKEVWFKGYLGDHWGSKHFWTPKNYGKMTSPLLESSSALPRLHGVWPLVMDAVRLKVHFWKFWKTVIDDGLITSSHERKYLAFQLVEYLLSSSLLSEEVGVIFSPNLMSCLLNNSCSTGNYLYSAARHVINELVTFIKSSHDQKVLTTLLVHFQRSTNGKFDTLSGSNIIQLIIQNIEVSGVHHLLEMYQRIMIGEAKDIYADDGDDLHKVQFWGVDQVLWLARNPNFPRSGSWLISAATLLMGHTFFSIIGPCSLKLPFPLLPSSTPLEPSLREYSQQRLNSILTDFSSMTLPLSPREGVARRNPHCRPGVMENGEYFIVALFQVARDLSERDDIIQTQPFTPQVQASWSIVSVIVQELSSKTNRSNEDEAFLLLFSVAGLGLLFPSERERHCQTISELEACWSEMKQEYLQVQKQTPVKRKKKQQGSRWMEVLTDLLLGLLSQPSQLWRINIEQAFKMLTSHINFECLQLILAILKPKQAIEEVMEEGKKEEEVEDSENDTNPSDDEEEEEDDDDDDGGGWGEGGVDAAFSEEVRIALGSAAVTMDSDGESESSLDDDAMEAIDDALGQVFRTRFATKHQKKQQKDDEKLLLHFKLRVLDLVDLILRRESTNPIIFGLILPLYEIVHTSQSIKSHSPLVERAGWVFINRLCHAKEYPKSCIDSSLVHDIFHQLIQSLYKATPTTSPLVTAGTMFLIRILRGSVVPPHISPVTTRAGRKRKQEEREETLQPMNINHGLLDVSMVTQWLSDVLHDYAVVKNSNIPPHFFTTYIERYPNLAVLLLPKMIQDLPSAANHFKKTQVHEMIAVLSGVGEGALLEGLGQEDKEVIRTIISKTKRKRRAKRKKPKTELATSEP